MVQDTELAILFADVVGSTRLFEQMGDLRARDLIATCIDIMRTATEAHGGTVIKTIGDEVMATFPTADAALNAAGQMQKHISTRADLKFEGLPVAIRVGCHFGPVVLESRDVFGASVHTANRMTSQAKAGQIMTTAATVERLSPEWRSAVRQVDVAAIRGQSTEMALFEVLWHSEDVTSMLPAITLSAHEQRRRQRLRLQVNGRDYVVDDKHPRAVIGRAEESTIVVQGTLISRLHARIDFNRNRFVITDQSTNGTFVAIDGQEEIFVRRDSIALSGAGRIGLGSSPDAESPQTIRFACEEY
jgi:class 3 adenylate cyclase